MIIHEELIEAARESIGVYPASWTKNGETVVRNEWQNGWNEALFQMMDHTHRLHRWYGTLTLEQAEALLVLLREDTMFFVLRDDTFHLYLIMNDTFGYSEANVVEVSIHMLHVLHDLWQRYGWDGLTAWAALESDQDVIRERKTEGYTQALQYISDTRLLDK